ncbi:TetR/AcrR family transcriptional regulator [Actinomadura barringtoniae]|uniref:TetR/AcrR family transcriptional regulator n=1 Tax=Actinomadura barringtoniae TaxID=1427535 RepID=A0A939TFB1_9ACTN|nr:TetR/AcrR family transcriptional regulator [Actinomadura barringtoniae]MBO2454180.1 TetR/AcrR family transcriptional regulator [Actinomadura barringtoniae]
MVRLTRAQQQERTRTAVLAAARGEFAERGYTDAKVDRIAERAELTRGAVYSNFPSKRALYLGVLADSVEPAGVAAASPPDLAEAAGAFARVWLERLPLTSDTPANRKLQLRSITGLFDDEPGRAALAQITKVEALLLALALESREPQGRRVRLAELLLTTLNGACHLAETAPGFGDPFDVTRSCEHLATLDLADTWDPPHLAYVAPARRVLDDWKPPAESGDVTADGVIVVLGTGRLGAAEEAVRAARPGDQITVAVVTSDPAEIGRLVRLRIGDLVGCLRRVFARDDLPSLRVVLDERATIASAIGIQEPDETTEAAVRIEAGRIRARADGHGAAHAAASAREADR